MDILGLDSVQISLTYTAAMPLHSILTINPNCTRSMTDALVPLVDTLGFNEVSLLLLPMAMVQVSNMASQ
jgi:hypothetical protein